jgi:hypothetical protein
VIATATNDSRVEWADACIRTLMKQTGADRDTALVDLLANLMHWADSEGEQFDFALRVAKRHYEEELTEEAKP